MLEDIKIELATKILPYWINKMQDKENGGFYGRIDGNEIVHKDANKGIILNTRILWTFSAAYRTINHPDYLEMAERAFNYINDFFIDKTYGGVYWELDAKGIPVNRKKQVYAQAFALYGFSEYFRATRDEKALKLAKKFFFLIEKCCDKEFDGYYEAFTEKWNYIEDMRLSEKDANEIKTMNTHLHILESYTNLCRIWNDDQLKIAQEKLITVFIKHIINKETFHLNLFFNENWDVKSTIISFGHDIEASWLLVEAAEVLDNAKLLNEVKSVSLKLANAALEGFQPDGSLIYEKENEHEDRDRHWWVQAESVVGLMYMWKIFGNILYREMAEKTWEYIRNNIIDSVNGEWFWSVHDNGTTNRIDDKAGFWKCPYHNSRMCLEIIKIFSKSQ